jgi:flagellar biosynthesis/type III secretory pathway chaperone
VGSLSIQEVIRSLESLNDTHETLLELGEQKKQVLIRNQVNELTQITNQESKLMKQVTEQEQQWLGNTSKFLEEKGYKPNAAMTMSELVKLVFKAEEKQALLDVQHKLMQTIEKLKEMNALNQQMIEQSLSYIDYTLDLMTGAPDQDMFYQKPSQQTQKSKGKGFFDTKA